MSKDFARRKITQSDYRGSTHRKSKVSVSLDTNLEPLTLPVKKIEPVELKILNETEAFLSRVLPEEVVKTVVNGKCIQSIFKKLGM